MRYGKCTRCGKYRKMTRHSLTGDHKPPFVSVCRKCHDELDGMRPQKVFGYKRNYGRKYQKDTKRVHKKGWRKK